MNWAAPGWHKLFVVFEFRQEAEVLQDLVALRGVELRVVRVRHAALLRLLHLR